MAAESARGQSVLRQESHYPNLGLRMEECSPGGISSFFKNRVEGFERGSLAGHWISGGGSVIVLVESHLPYRGRIGIHLILAAALSSFALCGRAESYYVAQERDRVAVPLGLPPNCWTVFVLFALRHFLSTPADKKKFPSGDQIR